MAAMLARTAQRILLFRPIALTALVAGWALAAGAGASLSARALGDTGRIAASSHAARRACPAVPLPYERESAEGRNDIPAPGSDPVCLRAGAPPRRPTRLTSAATAPSFAALWLHRAHAGSESCSGTSVPPPPAS